jgi:hypothetical protein
MENYSTPYFMYQVSLILPLSLCGVTLIVHEPKVLSSPSDRDWEMLCS